VFPLWRLAFKDFGIWPSRQPTWSAVVQVSGCLPWQGRQRAPGRRPESVEAATGTPAGEVAMAVHIGGYDRLREAHEAIHAWAAAHQRPFAGSSWEIYGDWQEYPAKLETTVVYLLS
jgi:hypothetical protein